MAYFTWNRSFFEDLLKCRNSYLYTYVAELYFSNIYCVTKVICIIDLNVTLFPFYVSI